MKPKQKSLHDLLGTLPTELYDVILKLTYKPQEKELLDDIVNFVHTKEQIAKYYYFKYIVRGGEEEPEHLAWLINDILRYYNDDFPTMVGYTYGFIKKICRHRRYRYFVWGDYVLNELERRQDTTQINILWSLLTPEERNEFIIQFCEE
jgi:hypothetical protein